MRRVLLFISVLVVISVVTTVFHYDHQRTMQNLKSDQSSVTPPGSIPLFTYIPRAQAQAAAVDSVAEVATPPPPTSPPPETPPAKSVTKPAAQKVVPAPAPKVASCSGSFNEQFLCLLNNYRTSKGKGKLSYSGGLTKVALSYSTWMATHGVFSHTGENGSHFYDRCTASGVTCHAENLAKGVTSAQQLFDMWKASAAHNANLLGPYTTIGLGSSGAYQTALFN